MSDTPVSDTVRLKAALREEAARRRAKARLACPQAGRLLVEILLTSPLRAALRPDVVVSGYWPIRSEIDPRPLMAASQELGLTPALPVMPLERGPLIFRSWDMTEPLEAHGFGTRVPREADGRAVEPGLILLPMLAFDRKGGRLGYGQGHFDRTLAALRARRDVIAVGIAFAAQEVEAVPIEPHDMPFDWVLTEREAIRRRP